MKDLRNFVSTYNEAFDPNASKEWVTIDGKKVRVGSAKYKEWERGKAESSETDPKVDPKAAAEVKGELSKNEKKIKMRMLANKPFYVIGHAGWGKSEIIMALANKMGYEVNRVFLDKAVKEDLGGIPIPVKSGDASKQDMAMPAWAAKMYENPDQKYLLFFDEMNQADPQVMNALMPIVQDTEVCGIKFDNFIVGAAGNYESENDAVNELSAPLKSRFAPLIVWDDNSPSSWKAAFEYLHKKLDEKMGKDLINKFQADCKLFMSPREIEKKVFDYIYDIWESGDYDDFTVDDFKDYLVGEDEEYEGLFRKDIARSDRDKEGRVLAQAMYDWIHRKETQAAEEASRNSGRRKNQEMLDTELVESMKKAIRNGYMSDPDDPKKKYGVAEENFLGGVGDRCIMSRDLCSPEQLARLVKTMQEKMGKDPWKFHKISEYKAKGYLDPPVTTAEEAEED